MWSVSVSAGGGHNSLFSVETLHIRQDVLSSESPAADWRPRRLLKGWHYFSFPHFFHCSLLLVGAFGVSARWQRATTRDACLLLSTVIPPTPHQSTSSLPFFFFLPGDCWSDGKTSSTPPPPPISRLYSHQVTSSSYRLPSRCTSSEGPEVHFMAVPGLVCKEEMNASRWWNEPDGSQADHAL